VVVQDTGFSEIVPTGRGLFAFSNTEQAEAAITAAQADPAGQGRAAREIAAGFFDARHVLGSLLAQVGLM
jgi:hypothetical protein